MADDTPQYSPQDIDLMTRTVLGEAGNQGDVGQAAVANVIANRVASGAYGGDNASSVVLAKNQFEPWSTRARELMAIPVDSPQYQHAQQIVQGVLGGQIPDVTGGATHFLNADTVRARGAYGTANGLPDWAQGQGTQIGAHTFYAPNGPVSRNGVSAINAAIGTPNSPQAGALSYADNAPVPAGLVMQAAARGDKQPVSYQQQADQSDDQILSNWLKSTNAPTSQGGIAPVTTAPTQAPPQTAAPTSDDDLLKQWAGTPPAAPNESPAANPGSPPSGTAAATKPITPMDLAIATATGVPIAGGFLNRMNAATNATLAPVLNGLFSPDQQLNGDWSERYDKSLAIQNGRDQQFAEQHPTANALANTTGAIAGTLAGARTAPTAMGVSPTATLGSNMLLGGLSNAAIGGADAAIRSGGDLGQTERGATIGGAAGIVGPFIGNAIGAGANKLVNLGAGTSAAARNVADVLEQAGMTPQQAQNALTRMGPNATLADVNQALTTEAGGLAALGGKPTSILKSAMATRAAGADDRVAQSVQQTLGPRPDITQLEEGIQQQASAAAAPHYANMRANGAPLDAGTVLDDIEQRLATANGSEKNILTRFRSYLYDPTSPDLAQQTQTAAGTNLNNITNYIASTGSNDAGLDQARQILVNVQAGRMAQPDAIKALSGITTTDPNANPLLNQAVSDLSNISPLKSDPQALLKVRQAVDDDISKMPMSDTTGGKNAERAANGIRGQLDGILKTNPDIQAGDTAYAQTISQRDALQEGQDLFKPATRIEDVQRSVAGKTTAQVNAMRQGALGTVWDTIDNARQGDLQAVKSLLGKSTANRAKLDALFPNAGGLFDQIQNEATMRATEQRVAGNSATAERQAVAQKYAPQTGGGAANGLSVASLAGEALGGNVGGVVAPIAKFGYGTVKNALTQAARDRLVGETAGGLSATGPEQQAFVNMLIRASQTAGANRGVTAGSLYGSNALLGGVAQQARQRQLPSQ